MHFIDIDVAAQGDAVANDELSENDDDNMHGTAHCFSEASASQQTAEDNFPEQTDSELLDYFRDMIYDDGSDADQGDEADEKATGSTSETDFLVGALRKWVAEYNITLRALQALLAILNNDACPHIRLPKDPRTIMHTPRTVEVISLDEDGSQYWHQGIDVCLRERFKDLRADTAIQLDINIDGLPLFRSSSKCFWPILARVYGQDSIAPMPVGIFYGLAKPKNPDVYIRPFVDELKGILVNGLTINGHKLTVTLRCFICDTPARAMIKGTKSYNARHGCQRCTVVGKHSGLAGCVIFPQIQAAELRTDAIFRARGYPEHQNKYTSLCDLPNLDMIRDFVVSDPLHLLELGVMKRLLTGWRTGNMACLRWEPAVLSVMSLFLVNIKSPREIQRDARSMDLFNMWKGLEFRNFLNYFGVVVLRRHLPTSNYTHFLKLFCATRLASSNKYVHRNLTLIDSLFSDFVADFKSMYGPQFMHSNMHNVLHIAEDVQRFGILPSMSAYPFESCLGKIKFILRTGQHPLKQVAKRLMERCNIFETGASDARHHDQPTLEIQGDKFTIHIPQRSFMLCNYRFQDKWFLYDGQIIAMVSAHDEGDDGIYVMGMPLLFADNFFTEPLPSSLMNIFVAVTADISDAPIRVHVRDITCKFFCIPDEADPIKNHIFIPILHTEE